MSYAPYGFRPGTTGAPGNSGGTGASIFGPCEGGVFVKNLASCDTSSPIVALSVDGFDANIAVTGTALELSTNHQFLHSLDHFIYVYSFGDRVGTFTMSGFTFTGGAKPLCGDATGTAPSTPNDIFDYYMQNRLSPNNLKPAKIQVSGTTQVAANVMTGFLTGFKMESVNPMYQIMQWVLQYQVIVHN